MAGWQDYVGALAAACDGLRVTSGDGELSSSEGLRRWIELTRLNVYVPAEPYAMVETAHALILHYWIDHYVLACKGLD